MSKISIRFFDDKKVRAVWDDDGSKWWFSVIDIVGVLSQSSDSRNYWYVLKNRLRKVESEVLTNCKGFKLMAPDGKRRMTDCLTNDGVIALAKVFPGKKANRFIEWFTYSDETIDGKSKSKAYALFDSSLLDTIAEVSCSIQFAGYAAEATDNSPDLYLARCHHSTLRF